MATNLLSLLKFIAPKKATADGVANTPTYNPTRNQQTLTLPDYRDHLQDIFETRSSSDSRSLLQGLFTHDPDMSAAVSAYLTVANTQPVFLAKDINGVIDRKAQESLNAVLQAIGSRYDYSTGFQLTPSIDTISENLRYMTLLRGGVGAELLLNKAKLPYGLRVVDPISLEWFEKAPGQYKPQQVSPDGSKISLDTAAFFMAFFHRDPTKIYTHSPFVSAINTISARQQVINDLYRIMRFTGYPRIELTVLEEVLRKSAPAQVKADPSLMDQWINGQVSSISSTITELRADQAFVHTDSVTAKILNDKNPAGGLNIDSIVGTLNAQNQAGLRSMSTILGRGESGVNTASVEARLFAMNAEELNAPVAEIWSQVLTMSVRSLGHVDSYVKCSFRPAEMRSALELEPHLIMRATRLRQDLSVGVITDDEYHLEMYGRIRPNKAPELSGTNFLTPNQESDVSPEDVSPNSDPLGRAIATPGASAAKGNIVKK